MEDGHGGVAEYTTDLRHWGGRTTKTGWGVQSGSRGDAETGTSERNSTQAGMAVPRGKGEKRGPSAAVGMNSDGGAVRGTRCIVPLREGEARMGSANWDGVTGGEPSVDLSA